MRFSESGNQSILNCLLIADRMFGLISNYFKYFKNVITLNKIGDRNRKFELTLLHLMKIRFNEAGNLAKNVPLIL